jgi:hypothetical protein
MKLRQLATGAVAASLLVVGLATPSYAESKTGIEFGYSSGDPFGTIYESIVKVNGREAARAFFDERVKAGTGASDLLQSLGELPLEKQTELLAASAEAAASGKPLPASYASLGAGGGGAVVMAVPTATQLGESSSGGRAWKATFRYNWATCPTVFSCSVDDWIEVKYTVNPGHTSSRTDITLLRWGSRLGSSVAIDARVYGNGALYDDNVATWSAPGTGIIWHYYGSLNNKSYTFWAIQTVSTPGGVVTTPAWKSGTGSCYTSAAYGPICSW